MSGEVVRIGAEERVATREEFGASQRSQQAELAALAVTARERALVEARCVLAERHPRNWDTVRVRILAHCDRPRFAEVARYRKPVGKKFINNQWQEQFAEGLSARFMETARQELGNIDTGSNVIYEDDLIRVVRASVWDLERNNTESREVAVAKAVERKGKQRNGKWEPPEGRDILSERVNSYGDPVYLVRATEDEVMNRQNNLISKAHRDCTKRLVPKDIQDEAEERIMAVLADPKKTDPAAARKRLVDSFVKIGVLPDDLVNYIGAPLDRISPVQLDELRGLWAAINDGDTTFEEALRTKVEGAAPQTPKQEAEMRQQQKADQQAVLDRKLAEAKGRRMEPTDDHVAEPGSPGPEVGQKPGEMPPDLPPEPEPAPAPKRQAWGRMGAK